MKSSPPAGSLESTIAKINNAVSETSSCGLFKELAVPPRLCGVYFLLRQDEIIYIAQSTNIIQRITIKSSSHTATGSTD